MAQTTLHAYAGGPILTEWHGTSEDDPTSILTGTTDLPAEAADTLNTHKDQQSAKEAQPHTDTTIRTAFTLTHVRYKWPKKTSIPYTYSHLRQMIGIQYSLVTLTMIHSDTSFIHFSTNDDPKSYMDYESDTTCSSYNTIKPVPRPLVQASLKASHIPRPQISKCSLQDHHALKTLKDNEIRIKLPTRTTKKSNISGASHIPVPRTSASKINSNIPRPHNAKNTKISSIPRPSPNNAMKDIAPNTEPLQPTIAANMQTNAFKTTKWS